MERLRDIATDLLGHLRIAFGGFDKASELVVHVLDGSVDRSDQCR